jgi:hypothetical protein
MREGHVGRSLPGQEDKYQMFSEMHIVPGLDNTNVAVGNYGQGNTSLEVQPRAVVGILGWAWDMSSATSRILTCCSKC